MGALSCSHAGAVLCRTAPCRGVVSARLQLQPCRPSPPSRPPDPKGSQKSRWSGSPTLQRMDQEPTERQPHTAAGGPGAHGAAAPQQRPRWGAVGTEPLMLPARSPTLGPFSPPVLFLLQGAEPRARPALPLSDMFDIRLFDWKPTKYQTYSYSGRASQRRVPPAWAQRPPPVL